VVDRISLDWRTAGLDEPDLALCEFADRLTRNPSSIGDREISRLRALGFDDAAISSATQVIAYFNYINRVAEGLGVPREDWLGEDGRALEG
jgi:uncharacterized peroxidase-related enzyme